ncbi:MAG: hydoxy methyltransferase [Lactobacillus sp.]|nr:hydoxy methyltransferase [Lactobacillus sp.]
MNIDNKLDRLHTALTECTRYYKESLPLCAAENVISAFAKIPLDGDFQERYIMGSPYSYKLEGNFIGSDKLLPFYSMIHDECQLLFGAHYADARTLSGMNCLTTLLMSVTSAKDRIAILPPEWGGHPSVQPVCERLGLQVFPLPYCHTKWDIDYDRANHLLRQEKIKYILVAPSDIIRPLSVEHFDLTDCVLLYDISQLMGLMAGGVIECPIGLKNTVIFGGTHKTLPGPASGLILTNDERLHLQIEQNINPTFLRHTQMHQVISLLFSLLETESYGAEYAVAIVDTANQLGNHLAQHGFQLGKTLKGFSETHQLFICCSLEEMLRINQNAIQNGITLNKKEKSLFAGNGIRLGTQEIARYGWSGQALSTISDILAMLRQDVPDKARIKKLKESLPPKTVQYTFPLAVQEKLLSTLHQK